MTTYSDIRGYRVKYLSSDPTLSTSNEGQVWYNSTEGKLKSLVQIKAWSAGGNLPTTKRFLMGTGVQTAALSAGGAGSPANSDKRNTSEEYNGNTWTSGGTMGTAVYGAGAAGTQTASLVFGGSTDPTIFSNVTQSYDGSTWSTPAATLTTGRQILAGFGIQTAALGAGGYAPPTNPSTATEAYDGTSWTAGGNLNTARFGLAGAGTQTAGLVTGGRPPASGLTNTEEYNGSTWTAVNASNISRQYHAASGLQTAAITFGGANPSITNTAEEYDGTSWSPTASMATARSALASSNKGASSSTSAFGGDTGPALSAATEEYFSSIDNYDPSSTAAWSSGGNINGPTRYGLGSGGPSTAAWISSGYGGPGPQYRLETEEYDGSTWTTANNCNISGQSIVAAGTQTSGLMTARNYPGVSPLTATEEYNGTNWTTVPGNLNQAQSGTSGCGTQTAALATRGRTAPIGTANEEYDGTSWATATTISGTIRSGNNAGIQTSALFVGGEQVPGPYVAEVEEYNGTAWTTGGSYPSGVGVGGNAGNSTSDVLYYSGYNIPEGNFTRSNRYDGTAWTADASVSAGRNSAGYNRSGATSAAWFAAGSPLTSATEEYNTGSPASPTGAAASTLTTS